MLRNTTFPLVAMTALASGYTVGRILADRNAPARRLEYACVRGAQQFITARHISPARYAASETMSFASPTAEPGAFIEISVAIDDAGQTWEIEIAAMTPRRHQQPVRHPLATVTTYAGETDTAIIRPLPAALIAALPGMLATLAQGDDQGGWQ